MLQRLRPNHLRKKKRYLEKIIPSKILNLLGIGITSVFKCLDSGHIQCPNKRAMIIRDNGELVTEEDKSDSDEIPKLKDASDVEWVEYL